jgi:iron complex outermembrane receptor protein
MFSLSFSSSKNDAVQLLAGRTPSVPSNRQYTSDDVVLTFPLREVSIPNISRQPSIISNQPRGETEQTIASINLVYDFGGVKLRSITGYVYTNDYFSTDFGGDGQVLGASTPAASQITEELQLQGTALDDRLNYLAGVYYLDEKGKQDFGWNITRVFFNVGPVSTSQIESTTKSISVFGQGDYALTDNLKFTAGGRWVQDKKTFKEGFQFLFLPFPLSDSVNLSNKYTEFTPKFGLDYKVDSDAVDSMLLYASWAKGFKSGGYNGINITDNNIARTTYAPETNTTFEAGLKADLLDRRLRVNAALFLAKIEDLALNATIALPNGTAAFPVQNAGEAKIRGLELETTYVPTENLTIFANAAFQNGKYQNLNPTSAPAQAPVLYNTQPTPPQLPDYTFTVGFDYGVNVPIGADGSRLSIGADWFRQDDYVTAATNDFVVKAYDRINATIGLAVGDHWDFRLNAKNLQDKDQIYVGSRGFLGGWLVLPPREIMFTIGYKQ